MRPAPSVARHARIAIAIFALLVASPLAPGAGEIANGAFTPAEVQKIIEGIQTLRGLKFRNKVALKYLTPAQVVRQIRADADHQNKAEIELDNKIGAMVGLFPAGTDIQSADIGMLRGQIAGLYDFRKKQMIIVERHGAQGVKLSESKRREATDVIAHELTHALQDQNFGIGAALEKAKEDDDRALALGAVAEGDATLSGFAYIAGRMDDEVLETFLKNIPAMEKEFAKRAGGVPLGIRAPFIFQYMDGARFVAAAYRRNGWAGVNALYKHPPESSEQILNPRAYFEHPAPPPRVRVAGYETGLKEWKKANEGTFGEVLLRVIIEANLGEHSPRAALAKAWDGDRVVVLKKSGAITLLWVIAFVSEASAANFAQVCEDALERLHGAKIAHRVERDSRAVLVIIGDAAKRSNDLVAQIWKKTTLSGAPLPN